VTTPTPVDDLDAVGSLLQLTLDTIVGTYEQAGVDLPERRYISYGSTAVDCEQLTVELGQFYSGAPGEDPNALQHCDGPVSAVMVVQLFRKAPVGSGQRNQLAPSADAITAMALTMAKDAWLLLQAAGAVDKAAWRVGYVAEVTPISTSGGMVGASMNFTMQVP
jgi:hypothetical protein